MIEVNKQQIKQLRKEWLKKTTKDIECEKVQRTQRVRNKAEIQHESNYNIVD